MIFRRALAIFSYLLPVIARPLGNVLVGRQGVQHHLLQYVQTFHTEADSSKHLSMLPLLNEKTNTTHVILAALHLNQAPSNITLNDNNPNDTYYDQTWSEAATLQQNGIKVMIMMGGSAQGSYNGRLCNSDGSINPKYYNPLVSTLRYHKIDGIDLDIEEVVPLACPENLVHRLKTDFGTGFIVTMAPVASDLTPTNSGLGGFSYKDFDTSSAGQMVDWYNTQYYSGFVEGSVEESYSSAVGNGFAASRIVLGALDSPKNGDGWLSLADLQGAVGNLKSKFADFGGVDGFEYFDAGDGDGLSDPAQWAAGIGRSLFGSDATRPKTARTQHTPPLPPLVAALMEEGYSQINAARAIRYAHGDRDMIRKILSNL